MLIFVVSYVAHVFGSLATILSTTGPTTANGFMMLLSAKFQYVNVVF